MINIVDVGLGYSMVDKILHDFGIFLRFQGRNYFGDLGKRKKTRSLHREGGDGIHNSGEKRCTLMKRRLNMILV